MSSDRRHQRQLCLVNEDLFFDGKRFVTRLGPYPTQHYIDGRFWHVTESGELYLLRSVYLEESVDLEGYELSTDPFGLSEGRRSARLADIESIVKYVREMATVIHKAKNYPLDQMAFVVWLAIYPGYFSGTENDEIRSQVIRAFCDGARSAGVGLAERRLAQYVLFLAATANVGPHNDFIRHCLSHIPLPFAGVLTAHGLRFKTYWQGRHREVLLEAWRYQLSHPYEPYTDPLLQPDSDWTAGDSKCLIERDITKEDRTFLLNETGLTEEDHVTALGIADAATKPNSQEYTQALLMQLARRSNLRTPPKPVIDVIFPPIILE